MTVKPPTKLLRLRMVVEAIVALAAEIVSTRARRVEDNRRNYWCLGERLATDHERKAQVNR